MNRLTLESMPSAVESLIRNQTRILESIDLIKEQINSLNQPSNDDLPINIIEASKVTGRAKGTLYNKVSAHAIPHHKKDGSIYFFKSELLEWLKTGKVETDEELEQGKNERLNNLFHNRKKR